jgi:methionyl-tRNA formyltransferase
VRLASLGAALVTEALPQVLSGVLKPVAQDHAQATLAPLLTKELGHLEWKRSAQQIHDKVRGLQPWPGCSTTLGARRMIVCETRLDAPPRVLGGAPGEIVAVTRDRIWVASSNGLVALTALQLEGKKRMTAREFMAGHPLRAGTVLGQNVHT